jgi:hypothetical protein
MDCLLDPPAGDLFAAASFAILQVDEDGKDKIRRGEDWRRSSHNTTVAAGDVPTHHGVQDFVDVVLRLSEAGHPCRVMGHDLNDAYRQFPELR